MSFGDNKMNIELLQHWFLARNNTKSAKSYTFIHKLTTKRNFQTPSLFFSCSKTRRIKNVKLSASQSRDKKSVRAYYDYEGNLQEVQKDYKGWV